MKRAVIFAHYDPDGIVAPYVLYYLQALRKISHHLVCVSTATLSKTEEAKLHAHCDQVICRENKGYDFMSYKKGLESLGHHHYDQLLFCNDSVYGPLFDLSEIVEKMDHHPCDFWGMTESQEISYHLQSYFLLFKKRVLHSEAFLSFWEEIKPLEKKEEIIAQYEVGLTSRLQRAGLSAQAYAVLPVSAWQKTVMLSRKLTPRRIIRKIIFILKRPSSFSSVKDINITLTFWEALLTQAHMPFIKVSLLRDNPNHVPIKHIYQVVSSLSVYDTALIEEHRKRIKGL